MRLNPCKRAVRVINQMPGNVAYPNPRVPMTDLATARNDFTAKIAAAQAGARGDNRGQKQFATSLARDAAAIGRLCADHLQQRYGSGDLWTAIAIGRSIFCISGGTIFVY